jgi:serine/threonine-protein kinase
MPDAPVVIPPVLADRYSVERELGRGGMATVHLALDRKHGRQVAIKVLNPELVASLGVERFLREIRIAARLAHPHILPLIDSGEAGGLLYYVMPYVPEGSLRQRLDRDGRLPPGDALRIAREVGTALDYAHRQGFVHRDVKPENILFADGLAVLADFGIARAFASAGADAVTEVGLALGTPEYMSPEQASGERDLGGPSDLYSLACVVYEMLAG